MFSHVPQGVRLTLMAINSVLKAEILSRRVFIKTSSRMSNQYVYENLVTSLLKTISCGLTLRHYA
ncbi:CLUMA_CG019271, isoform A [Clunio marinus]|uniref:CLUMA_CG019271, isoform A n=1 Tax=Clunio marinus TaxID=568069 RepID=A0A1J1J1L0_9DIPT|nr:CLUMA_CG019271, isoform A [Clunio marinus]